MDEQINAESVGKPSEVSNPENTQVSFVEIQQKLSQHGEILKRLANTPTEVNADGLKHLADQSTMLAQSMIAIKEALESKTTNLETEMVSIKDDYNKGKLELEKIRIIKQYDLPDEVAVLLDKVAVEELAVFAENLSKVIGNKFPAKLGATQITTKVPSHLQNVADSLLKK